MGVGIRGISLWESLRRTSGLPAKLLDPDSEFRTPGVQMLQLGLRFRE